MGPQKDGSEWWSNDVRVEAGCFYGETGAKRNEDILPIARPSGLGVKRGWRKSSVLGENQV